MTVRIDDLQLVWPRDLFIQEFMASTIRNADPWDDSVTFSWTDRLDLLFIEAFYDSSGAEWLTSARAEGRLKALLTEIVADPACVPIFTQPVLYRDRRSSSPVTSKKPRFTFTQVRDRFEDLVKELDSTGYFDAALGTDCVDSDNDHEKRGRHRLSDLMGSEEHWPPSLAISGEDHTYTVVEAIHLMVARPRLRNYHSYGSEWHYSDFDRRAGRAVYRWRVNELLEQSGSLLRLDETGVLVETTGDPRDELLETLAHDEEAPSPNALHHAIDQFRRRGATREDKRAAIIALSGILETNRALLKEELLRSDEGALFNIANSYAIRHQRADQRPDYDDAYLDWIFWWYLATVALVKELLARQAATST